MIDIGQRLSILKIVSGLSNKEIAQKMNLSESAVSFHLNGKREIGIRTLNDYCLLFNTTMPELLSENVTYLNRKVEKPVINRVPSIKQFIENATEEEIKEIDTLIAGYINQDRYYGKRENSKCENSN